MKKNLAQLSEILTKLDLGAEGTFSPESLTVLAGVLDESLSNSMKQFKLGTAYAKYKRGGKRALKKYFTKRVTSRQSRRRGLAATGNLYHHRTSAIQQNLRCKNSVRAKVHKLSARFLRKLNSSITQFCSSDFPNDRNTNLYNGDVTIFSTFLRTALRNARASGERPLTVEPAALGKTPRTSACVRLNRIIDLVKGAGNIGNPITVSIGDNDSCLTDQVLAQDDTLRQKTFIRAAADMQQVESLDNIRFSSLEVATEGGVMSAVFTGSVSPADACQLIKKHPELANNKSLLAAMNGEHF